MNWLMPQVFVLVPDDYHDIQVPGIGEMVAKLLDDWHLVLRSRSNQRLNSRRWRLFRPPAQVEVGQEVRCDAGRSQSSDRIVSYAWGFGDG
jgi:hypothetical protein